jgi:hypothetical protein
VTTLQRLLHHTRDPGAFIKLRLAEDLDHVIHLDDVIS